MRFSCGQTISQVCGDVPLLYELCVRCLVKLLIRCVVEVLLQYELCVRCLHEIFPLLNY